MPDNATLEKLIDRYCEAWNERNPGRRESILREVLAEGAVYIDPRGKASSALELSALIETIASRRPGARVVRTSAIDAHHNLARFAWHVIQSDGTALPESVDFVELSPKGRIARVVGFFGPLRAA